jgi:hypothetical protein
MNPFVSIILVCALATPPRACDEVSAVDVLVTPAYSELQCANGLEQQESIARTARREGKDVYVRTLCRRTIFSR